MRPVGSKYLLEEPLGRGATGTVWRAWMRDAGSTGSPAAGQPAGEPVAIKVLREELAGDPDVVMRFLRERSALVRLTHPNIVRVRDLVVEGDLLALVMDLVDGPDLHRYLRDNGPFSPMAAALLTAPVADALAASHRDGVVHRDLKPANVLLAATGEHGEPRPMLTDFGIARLADSPGVTRTHEFVGTPAYVAPESAEGGRQTSAVDVYGAGILLYELITGNPPFRGESAIEVLHQHLTDAPRRPSTVPDPLWTVIERCLRKDPAERPSAESLARALRVVGLGVGVHATPAAAEAALEVAGLLMPDPVPAQVPGTGNAAGPDAVPTRVMPSGARPSDPTVPNGFGPGGGGPDGGPDAATSVLPTGGSEGATRAMPPMPGYQPQPQPQPQQPPVPPGPHPWESQLSAARRRGEQTEVRYLDPEQDPLRHRPHRRPAPEQPPAGYQEPYQRPYDPAARRAAPPPYAEPRRYAEPQPERYAEPRRRPEPEPVPRREPRRRGRTRIPGAGCLKGCLFLVLLVVVLFILVWNFTPVPQWVAEGQTWWQAMSHWVGSVWHWASYVVRGSGTGSGGGTG